MTEMWFYLSAMCTASLIVAATWLHKRNEPLLRTMATIVAVWFVGRIYVVNTGDATPWEFNIFIDSAAAAVIMLHPALKMQAVIALLYFIQIAFHAAYGIREITGRLTDDVFYYDAITYVALAQLLAMGAWCGRIWGKVSTHRGGGRFHAVDRRKGAAYPEARK